MQSGGQKEKLENDIRFTVMIIELNYPNSNFAKLLEKLIASLPKFLHFKHKNFHLQRIRLTNTEISFTGFFSRSPNYS